MTGNSSQIAERSADDRTLALREKAEIEVRFGRHINRGQLDYLRAGRLDLVECRREGIGFSDLANGRQFIDCFTSAGCFNVGRHNPEMLNALEEAINSVDMGSYDMVSSYKVALAKKLVSVAPGDLNRLLFAAGGGDAIDAAIKLARGATRRREVIACVKAYHGHTGLALSANGKEHYRGHFEPLDPAFRFVPFNDLRAAEAVASDQTAAIILEPVQGEAGIFVATDDYLLGLRRLCDRVGAVLILDEIQTGFCRTGRFFACEHSGVVPDIMTVAKSLGGGLYPNAAVLYRDTDLLVSYVEGNPSFHPSYSGGSDIGCRLSLQVLEYLERNRLWENAEKMGARLKEALIKLRDENPGVIKEVRGKGLMIGIEYLHEFMGPMMSQALARHGVLAAFSGNAPQVMRFMPPIVITDEEMNILIRGIREAVKSMNTLLPLALPAARIPAVLKLLNNERVQTLLFGWVRSIEDAISLGVSAVRGR
jgi:putrescine aminotransferase